MAHAFCGHCGSGLFVVGFVAGAEGAEPVFIHICPECDGPAVADREAR